MKELKSKQRAYLMKLASSLDPIFQIGKSSLTPEGTAAISEAFNTRELIKIAAPILRSFRSSAKRSFYIKKAKTIKRSNCLCNLFLTKNKAVHI